MNRQRANQRSATQQSGTVLISVLMMVAIAALIVTDMTYRQQMDIKRTSALLARDQAFQYLLGAEELAKLALSEDLKTDMKQGNGGVFKDTLKEEWAQEGQPFPVPGGFVRGRIFDLQARINLNDLVNGGGNETNTRLWLIMMMRGMGIPDNEGGTQMVSADMLAERLIDWLDANDDPVGDYGAEDLTYMGLPAPYRASNRLIFDPSELMLIEGFKPEYVAKMAPFITFLPSSYKINVNTAPTEILSLIDNSLGPVASVRDNYISSVDRRPGMASQADLDKVLQRAGRLSSRNNSRTTTSFTLNKADDEASNSGNTKNNSYAGKLDYKSEYYLLEAEAAVAGKRLLMQSILYRPALPANAKATDVKVKTLLRKLLDPLKGV